MTQEEEQIQPEEPTCMHHWMIESPNGPVSMGTCKVCGETQEFKNSIQGSGWDRESPQSKRARQARSEQQKGGQQTTPQQPQQTPQQ